MKNKVEDVRNHLVQMMETLNDEKVDAAAIERAKAMSGLATAYVGAVKVELDALRLAQDVGFLPAAIPQPVKCPKELSGGRP